MVKKMVSIATVFLMLCCMIPFAAFSDDVLDTCPKCGERTYETWTDCSTEVPDIGFPISVKRRHCTSCDYTYYDWNCLGFTGYKEFDKGSGVLLADYLKEWRDKTFGKNANSEILDATNGGANIPAAGGRNPKGYGDEGKANVTSSGAGVVWAEPFGVSSTPDNNARFVKDSPSNLIAGSRVSGSSFPFSNLRYLYFVYTFTAPVSGLYYVGSSGSPYDFGTFSAFSSTSSKWELYGEPLNFDEFYYRSISLKENESCYYMQIMITNKSFYQLPYKFYLNRIDNLPS